MDFLFELIEGFSLGVTAEAIPANIAMIWACLKGAVLRSNRYVGTFSTNHYIKVTTLSGVSYASVYIYEQTHSRQCCNLFIS